MKKALFIIFALFACFGLFAQHKPVIVGAPFNVLSGVSKGDADVITDIFYIELNRTNKVTLVDRTILERVIQEHHFQAGDWSNDAKTAELGKALNADWIVRAEIRPFGSRMMLTVMFFDIRELKNTGGEYLRITNIDDAFDEMEKFVNGLVNTISAVIRPTVPISTGISGEPHPFPPKNLVF